MTASYSNPLFDEKLEPLQFAIGPVPVVITQDIGVVFDANMNASCVYPSADMSMKKAFGFEYFTDVGVTPNNEDESSAPQVSCSYSSGSASASLSAGLNFSYQASFYDVFGPQLSTGIRGELSASIDGSAGPSATAVSIPGISNEVAGSANAKIYVPVSGKLELSGDAKNIIDGTDASKISGVFFDTGDAITLYDWRPPSSSASAGMGSSGGSASSEGTLSDGRQVVSGMVHVCSNKQEVVDLQKEHGDPELSNSVLQHEADSQKQYGHVYYETTVVLMMDSTQELTGKSADGSDPSAHQSPAYMLTLEGSSWSSYDGKHVTIAFSDSDLVWPSDTTIPVGQPWVSNASVIG